MSAVAPEAPRSVAPDQFGQADIDMTDYTSIVPLVTERAEHPVEFIAADRQTIPTLGQGVKRMLKRMVDLGPTVQHFDNETKSWIEMPRDEYNDLQALEKANRQAARASSKALNTKPNRALNLVGFNQPFSLAFEDTGTLPTITPAFELAPITPEQSEVREQRRVGAFLRAIGATAVSHAVVRLGKGIGKTLKELFNMAAADIRADHAQTDTVAFVQRRMQKHRASTSIRQL